MVGIFLTQLVCNAIIFSFIFWALTFVAKLTYSNKYYNYKLNFYECGFKTIIKKKPIFEINFVMILLFILIYDGEFLVLIPFAMNTSLILNPELYLCVFFFFIWFILTVLIDYSYSTLEWQVIVLFYIHSKK